MTNDGHNTCSQPQCIQCLHFDKNIFGKRAINMFPWKSDWLGVGSVRKKESFTAGRWRERMGEKEEKKNGEKKAWEFWRQYVTGPSVCFPWPLVHCGPCTATNCPAILTLTQDGWAAHTHRGALSHTCFKKVFRAGRTKKSHCSSCAFVGSPPPLSKVLLMVSVTDAQPFFTPLTTIITDPTRGCNWAGSGKELSKHN